METLKFWVAAAALTMTVDALVLFTERDWLGVFWHLVVVAYLWVGLFNVRERSSGHEA